MRSGRLTRNCGEAPGGEWIFERRSAVRYVIGNVRTVSGAMIPTTAVGEWLWALLARATNRWPSGIVFLQQRSESLVGKHLPFLQQSIASRVTPVALTHSTRLRTTL